MGIADGGGAEDEAGATDRNGFIDNLAWRPGDRNFVAAKTDAAHFDTDHFTAVENGGTDQTAVGLEDKLLVANEAGIPEEAGEDAEAVAAFFGQAAVGIINFEGAFGGGRGEGAEEDAVGADAIIAVANGFDLFSGEGRGQVIGVKHDVIITEGMIF